MEKATLIKITNPFNRVDREISKIEVNGESLFHLRHLYFPDDVEIAVSLNGRLVKDIDLPNIKPNNNDFITFIPVSTGDGGDKDIIRAIAFVGLALASWGVGTALSTTVWGGTLAGYAAAVPGVWGIASVVGSIATMLVGGLLINALLPPSMPEVDSIGSLGGATKSQTYSWSPKTTQQQGTVIPKIYGTMKASGNIIGVYTESTGSDVTEERQYLSVLIGLGMGPVNRI